MKGLSKTEIYVPVTLELEILSKLPVKSLTRFRLVCKAWSSSFHTPLFSTKHHQNNLRKNNLNLLLKRSHGIDNTQDDIYYISQLSTEKGLNFSRNHNIHLPIFEDCSYVPEVCGPCNGLLCLHECANVALWNPSTRVFKILPESSVQRPPNLDYTGFGYCFGFGYDPQTDDYKIVRFVTNYILADHDEWNEQVELYSLKRNSWTEIVPPGEGPFGGHVFNAYVNGFYYWTATGYSGRLILAFDMVNEKFSTLPMPEFGVSLTQYYWEVLDFNGLLGAIVYPIQGTEKSFDIWVMNGCWSKQFRIESVPGVERPLGFWKDGELFLTTSDHELVLYDPSIRKLKHLGIHAYQRTMQIITYAESLVLFNGRSEYEERIIRVPQISF